MRCLCAYVFSLPGVEINAIGPRNLIVNLWASTVYINYMLTALKTFTVCVKKLTLDKVIVMISVLFCTLATIFMANKDEY